MPFLAFVFEQFSALNFALRPSPEFANLFVKKVSCCEMNKHDNDNDNNNAFEGTTVCTATDTLCITLGFLEMYTN